MTAIDRAYESRCIHGMIEWPTLGKSSCSICLRLPYTIASPLAEFEPIISTDEVRPRVVWLPLEERTDCVLCDRPLDRGKPAAWMDRYEGTVGECCREAVAS